MNLDFLVLAFETDVETLLTASAASFVAVPSISTAVSTFHSGRFGGLFLGIAVFFEVATFALDSAVFTLCDETNQFSVDDIGSSLNKKFCQDSCW